MCMHIYKYMIKLLVTDKLSEKYLTKLHRIELLNAIKTIKTQDSNFSCLLLESAIETTY